MQRLLRKINSSALWRLDGPACFSTHIHALQVHACLSCSCLDKGEDCVCWTCRPATSILDQDIIAQMTMTLIVSTPITIDWKDNRTQILDSILTRLDRELQACTSGVLRNYKTTCCQCFTLHSTVLYQQWSAPALSG